MILLFIDPHNINGIFTEKISRFILTYIDHPKRQLLGNNNQARTRTLPSYR